MNQKILLLVAGLFCMSCDLDMTGHFDCDNNTDCGATYRCSTTGQCVVEPLTKDTDSIDSPPDDKTDSTTSENNDSAMDNRNSDDIRETVPGEVQFVNAEGYTVNRNNDANYRGAGVSLWKWDGSAGQQWFWESDGTIRSATDPDFCLNMHYGVEVWKVLNLWDCNNSVTQRWIRIDESIRPIENTTLCLNLHGNDNRNASVLNLWECNGNVSQKWSIIER